MMNLSTDVAKIVDRERFEAADARRLARMTEAYLPETHNRLASPERPEIRGWRVRSLRVAQDYWWVPAGFAVLLLLRAIAGA
jgi:hypothetical protein